METGTAANPLIYIFPYILIFFIFYFLVIRPQKKQEQEKKNMIANVKKNDHVVTAAGIHGTVVLVKDQTVVVRVDDNVKIEFDKEAIRSVTKSKES